MAASLRVGLVAALALGGANALQIPLQQPVDLNDAPSLLGDSTGAYSKLPLIDTEKLQASISRDSLKKRAEDFYELAKEGEEEYGHPTRVIGGKGHRATIKYIRNALAETGDYYQLSHQSFPAVTGDVFESRLVIGNHVPSSATPMSLTPPTKNREPEFGNVVLIDNDGCDASDYPPQVKLNIALVKRGACSFGTKSERAGQAGAIGVIIYNNEEGDVHGTLGTPSPDHVATFGISKKYGDKIAKELKDGENVDAIIYIDGEVRTIMTSNIIAQTSGGDQDNCVMLGGHSDSVPEGPGINDDGSGSISVLEVALRLTDYRVNNCVRFAWWAAEEEGLLGSDFYVASLSEEENKKIRLFMDYDMMGSPNYAYQVYNASNDANPAGSGELKQLYIDWYVDHGLNYTLIPFDGRSDYDGFIRGGIPAGGIATGAEGVKTEEEAVMFGGKAGDWYDPCYHQLCDDTDNVDLDAWEVNTKLIAHSVATYARSFDGFPKRSDEKMAQAYSQESNYHGPKLVIPGFSDGLWTDCVAHSRVMEALIAQRRSHRELDILVPNIHAFVAAEDRIWWKDHESLMPSHKDFPTPCRTLISERIPPVPKAFRQTLIDRYCPPSQQAIARQADYNNDCLARVYLSRRSSKKKSANFTLRNFNLHIDQLRASELPVQHYAASMAEALATIHWAANVSAYDIEFVLGGCRRDEHDSATFNFKVPEGPRQSTTLPGLRELEARLALPEERYQPQPATHRKSQGMQLWVLDFNLCGMWEESVGWEEPDVLVGCLVEAFFENDPYYPLPLAEYEEDRELWEIFREAYTARARIVLQDKDMRLLELPRRFLDACEERERQRLATGRGHGSRDQKQ
ncbi:peptidase family m28 domain-containing protein [Sarocladium implicatum]|nr:peptidase family m28 domain-containing protein [Sarocladium implicatum]